jgi:hypothetical protein
MKEGAAAVDVALIEAGVVEVVEEPLPTPTALVQRRLPSSPSLPKSPLHGTLHQRIMMDWRLPSQLTLGVVLLRRPHRRLQLQLRR